MSKKRKIIIICCCLALVFLLCVIPIINRVFILAVKYNVDGQSVDCSQAWTIGLDGFDGVESCWGYGINMQDKKIYFGIDFGGLSEIYLGDGCDVDADYVGITYHLEFPQKIFHRFWIETVYLDFEKDDAKNIQGTVNTDHHIQYRDDLTIRDEIELGDRVIPYDNPQTRVYLRF